jgi:hypothetical protein
VDPVDEGGRAPTSPKRPLLPIPPLPLLAREGRLGFDVLIHLVGEVRLVRQRRLDRPHVDTQVLGGPLHRTLLTPQRRDDVVNVEPGSDQRRSSPPGASSSEADERMAVRTQRLAEELLRQGVA